MQITRRSLIVAAVAAPGVLVVERLAKSAIVAVSGAAHASRPAASGTSATRCAQCGSDRHTMLDPRCPMAPRVLA
jgi:hypothetical protein